jgi:hypothetical protein
MSEQNERDSRIGSGDAIKPSALERPRKRKWLWIAGTAAAVLLVILVVPPWISIGRYKSQITQLISASVGRPVRLSSVELRLFPRPGFLLTDLSIADDPAYSNEPILHADSVHAYIGLASLWSGRLQIGAISVEDASLNVVRSDSGRWNLDPFLRTATTRAAGSPARVLRLPSLRATTSRINFKRGAEKLPFSLVNADIAISQDSPGEWNLHFRGQPTRTDIGFDSADTGVLRAEATLHAAPELRHVPIHLEVNWREAQLGQLYRLLFGTNTGWRGDLTADLSLDGNGETAQVHSRLRATGVHRAEFSPAEPLDFDAHCNLQAHFLAQLADNLNCDTPLGSGRIHVAGALSAGAVPPNLAVELDHIPVTAALDMLRTVRSDFGKGLEASGAISGRMVYAPQPEAAAEPSAHPLKGRPVEPPSPLTGSFTAEKVELRSSALGEPVRAAKIAIDPAPYDPTQPLAVSATASIPAGASAPLAVSARFSLEGYQLSVRGPASVDRARQMALALGLSVASALDSVAGEPLTLDMTAQGPWMVPVQTPFGPPAPAVDTLSGTVALRNANWHSNYLLNPVQIPQATLHIGSSELRFEPLSFVYGPLKGMATIALPVCDPSPACTPHVTIQFGSINAAVAQSAFLGAHAPGTLLSTLIERIHPTPAAQWPEVEGTVRADTLILGPVTLRDAQASLRTTANGADISAFDAGLLGGRLHLTGRYRSGTTASAKPTWTLDGSAEKLNGAQLAAVLGLHGSGGTADLNGKLESTGFTGDDLAASTHGKLHFEWQKSAVFGPDAPASLARFDRWSGEAEIGSGALTLKQSQARRGVKAASVDGSVALELPARLAFPAPPKSVAKPVAKAAKH